MRTKLTFFLLLAVAISACSKSNDAPLSSSSVVGTWKFSTSYNVTFGGTQRTKADPAKPVIWNFNATSYSITSAGKPVRSGPYVLLDKYQYSPGYYATNVLKMDSLIAGTYAIHRGSPDTLLISQINPGPDNGGEATYLRVK